MTRFLVSPAERAAMNFGAVYIVRDRFGTPIYVGQTGNLGARVRDLQSQRWWIHEAASIEAAHRSDDEWDRRAVETRLIGEHQPIWNVQCRSVRRGATRRMQDQHCRTLAAEAVSA